ncbi:uncharacterized protein LOC112690209 isoform X2 [Sipha flava]|uniref:Uncharacterized protein LOC112690209 isoform X2 n=1 Tax=Sipha flava TaxID=143950 RepID=A0A8B8GAM5_9HEMI|nr:uncharacterized protein LOC112690209 isoform X2 [Sipha flava]
MFSVPDKSFSCSCFAVLRPKTIIIIFEPITWNCFYTVFFQKFNNIPTRNLDNLSVLSGQNVADVNISSKIFDVSMSDDNLNVGNQGTIDTMEELQKYIDSKFETLNNSILNQQNYMQQSLL